MNRRKKGMVTMRKARELGEKQGFQVEQALHTKFKADYFGLFDQMWLKEERLIFVQIKTNQSIGKSMRKTFGDWSKEHNLETMIMNLNEKKEVWEILRYDPDVIRGVIKDMFLTNEIQSI